MAQNPALPETDRSWIGFHEISTTELSNRYGISREELTSFQGYIRVYPYDSVIIQEGDTDRSLYLVRYGSVGVYRQMRGQSERIAAIDAVNFVGEMSLFNDEPRCATVKAESDQVLVYALAKPSFNLILSNPKWSEILISRLCKNLAQNNTQMVAMSAALQNQQEEIEALRSQVEGLCQENQAIVRHSELAFAGILHFETVTRDLAVVGSKGWAYLKALTEVSKALLSHYLPGAQVSEQSSDIKVMKKCLTSIQPNNPASVFEELFRSF
jgi:CRP/FNR family transcriptional regulator, cyclic AMP receptor protein